MLDLDAIAKAPLKQVPFKFFVVPGTLSPVDLAAVRADFPEIRGPGLYPLSELSYGPAFAHLVEQIRGDDFAQLLERKFAVDLSDKPLLITVRGMSHRRDGRIHTDSKAKFLTCIIYLNDIWDESGGRLRLLNSNSDLNDVAAEIPPDGGTLASYLRTDNSWHGHDVYAGTRRYLMLTWMTSHAAFKRELGRHTLSARLKKHLQAGRSPV